MQAIKINSAERKLEIVQIENWKKIAPAIGNGCTTFACPVSFENGDTIYTDDEGLFHPFDGGFIMEDWYCPLVGNAIILGTDYEGESIDAQSTIEEIEKSIKWVDKQDCLNWQSEAMNNGPVIYYL